MTGPRVNVGRSKLSGKAIIAPQASPVDRFVRTSDGSQLAQVSQALGKLSPEVAKIGSILFEAELKKDIEGGADAATQASLLGHKSESAAVRAGAMSPDKSPAYRRAAQEVFGANAAAQYGRDLGEFISSSLQGETDMEIVQAKVDEFRDAWMTDNLGEMDSKYFQRTFARQAVAIQANSLMNLSWNVGKNYKADVEDNVGQLAVNALSMEMAKPDFNPALGVQALGAIRQKAYDMGVEGKKVNEIIFTTVSEKAIAEGNPDMIEMLAMMPGPNGTQLVENHNFTLRLSRAYREAVSQESFIAKIEKDKNNVMAIAVYKDLNDELLSAENPSTVNLKPYQLRMNLADPKQVEDLARHRQAVLIGMTREDDAKIGLLVDPMLYDSDNPLTEGALRKFLGNEVISTRQYQYYSKKIKERDRVMADPSYPRYRAAVSRAKTVAKDKLSTEFGPVQGEAPRAAMRHFQAQLRNEIEQFAWEWKDLHPAATDAEVHDALNAEVDMLVVDLMARLRAALPGEDTETE